MSRASAASIALLLAVVPAHAAAQTAEDRAAADALFAEGKRLLGEGKTDQACAKFAASLELAPRLGTRLNLADCYERAGKTASAWSTFRTAAAEAKKAGDDRAGFAGDRAAKLEDKLTKLRIIVPPDADVPGLEVKRDGVPVPHAALGSEVPVDPGDHHIEAQAPGYKTWSTDVTTAGEGRVAEVTLAVLEKAPVVDTGDTPTPIDPREAARRRRTRRIIAVSVGTVGVVSLATGGVFALIARSKWSDAQPHCGADNSCDATGYDLTQEARSAGNIASIAMGVAGVALVAGAILWLTAPSVPVERSALRITPIVDPSGGAFVAVFVTIGGGF